VGGLRTGAQLDKIHVRRNGRQIPFDYKLYLDTGNEDLLPELKSLDVIFVPASAKIGNVEVNFDPAKVADSGDASEDRNAIKVFGEVNSAGTFSYREGQTILDILMRAGGVTRYAGVEQIRIISDTSPRLFNLKMYLDTGDQSLLPDMVQGSTVFVPKQEVEIKTGINMVYVMGEVQKPGAYENKEGATFMDILSNAGGPTRYADAKEIRIIRADGSVTPFDLTAFTDGYNTETPDVHSGDAIFIPEKTDMNEKSWLKVPPTRAVSVIGSVVRPGRIEWSEEMSLIDLLAHVGGPTRKANTAAMNISIPNQQGHYDTFVFNLDTFISEGKPFDELPVIIPGSIIRVTDLPDDPTDNKSQWISQPASSSIYVFGQVGSPGRYAFTDQLHFLDILSAADGPTGAADLHNIRINHRNHPYRKVSKLNLALYFETGDESLIPKVLPGDTIYVPQRERAWIETPKEETIRIIGAINKPGRYQFKDDMTILDVLAEAGGPANGALLTKISVVNVSCCQDQAKTFDLTEFYKTGNMNLLPVVRNGDTIYIPNQDEDPWNKGQKFLTEFLNSISIILLLTGGI
jgi:protein involved in polysaccharide export with SLBB domain